MVRAIPASRKTPSLSEAAIRGLRRSVHKIFQNPLKTASDMLSQVLGANNPLLQPRKPMITIETAGSGIIRKRIPYKKKDTVGSLMEQLDQKKIENIGGTFVTYYLCIQPVPGQPEDKCYNELAPDIAVSELTQRGKYGITLQVVKKKVTTDSEKVKLINDRLKNSLTKQQQLDIIEVIRSIQDFNERFNICVITYPHFVKYKKNMDTIRSIMTHCY